MRLSLPDGRVIRRHVDHIRSREPAVEVTAPAQDDYKLSDGSSGVMPNGQLASSAPLLRCSCRNRRPQKAVHKSRPGRLLPSTWCFWVVHESTFHLWAKARFQLMHG